MCFLKLFTFYILAFLNPDTYLVVPNKIFSCCIKFSIQIIRTNSQFPIEKEGFLTDGSKDGDFLFWSSPEPIVTFLGLKNHTSP